MGSDAGLRTYVVVFNAMALSPDGRSDHRSAQLKMLDILLASNGVYRC